MNSRAILGFSLIQTLELIIAVMLILGTSYFFKELITPLISPSAGQLTMSNFNNVNTAITELLDNKESTVEEKGFPFYIEPGYFMIGFDKGTPGNPVNTNCFYYEEKKTISKPLEYCGESACLCLFKDSGDKTSHNYAVVRNGCMIFNKADSFNTAILPGLNDQGNLNLKANVLDSPKTVIYGQCGNTIPLGTVNLYLKKTTTDKTTIITINPN